MDALALFVFCACSAVLAYVFVAYPLGMFLVARWRPRPVYVRDWTPTVSVILAVHDGAAWVEAKLANLAALDYPHEALEIIIVCDGCDDATAAIAQAFEDPRVRLLVFEQRRGKAACLNDAVAAARGECLLMTDVRQQLQPAALRELTANLADERVGAVSGELRLHDAQSGFAKGVGGYWRYEKFIRHAESRAGSTVGVTGALYAMRRSLFQALPEQVVLDDVLVPMRVAAAGYRVVFEPAAVAWDRPAQGARDEQRRKIRTLAGNYQLLQLAPWLALPWYNPLWWRFVSHKLLRLLAPWLLLAWLLAAVPLAHHSVWFALLLCALGACAVLLLAARLWPAVARITPVRLLQAFCYLNLFAAQALFAFFRNRRLHLW